MWFSKTFVRYVSFLCILCILNIFACYKRVLLPPDKQIPVEEKIIILHTKNAKWYIYNVEIENNQLHGYVTSSIPKHLEKQEVSIYFDSSAIPPLSQNENISIDISAIQKVYVSKFDATGPIILGGIFIGLPYLFGVITSGNPLWFIELFNY